jgi:hypothetical protein
MDIQGLAGPLWLLPGTFIYPKEKPVALISAVLYIQQPMLYYATLLTGRTGRN